MLGDKPIVAFVATAKPDEARAFYENVLGLRFVTNTPVALIFDASGTALRIAKVGSVTIAPNTVLGWEVTDIAADVAALNARAVRFERYPGVRAGRRWRLDYA